MISAQALTENSKIFITVHQPVLIAVTKIDPILKTFIVELLTTSLSDITFDWWIVDNKIESQAD